MPPSSSFKTSAFFLDGLFCLYYQPANTLGCVLYLPPFAEEMHKSRRMAALQARALAQQGYAVLQLDLWGCGDSAGEFVEADWQRWQHDARHVYQWLSQQLPYTPLLWGLRSGGLLAYQLAQQLPTPTPLLLWQPLLDGKSFLKQWLRLKLASQLFDDAASREQFSTEMLLQQLMDGNTVEVGGYLLSPALAQQLAQQKLSEAPIGPVYWFEIGNSPSPAHRRYVDHWQLTAGCNMYQFINGPAFWLSQEIVELPSLIQSSLQVLKS